MTRRCPHCAADNPSPSAFCSSCGKSFAPVPSAPAQAAPAQPAPQGAPLRSPFLGQAQAIASDPTAGVDMDQLAKHMKWAVTVPATLSVLCMIAAGIIIAVGFASASDDFARRDTAIFYGAIVGGLGMLYFGIHLWAKRDPLPAAIAGLCLYLTPIAIDAAVEPSALFRGLILKIAIITMLAKAIDAASKHRALTQRLAAQASAPLSASGQFRKVA